MIQGSPFFGSPMAPIGYVGFIRLTSQEDGKELILRVTTADLSQSQDIEQVNVIDSRYDNTVYRLQSVTAGGNVAFPAIFDPQGGTEAVRELYNHCIYRDNYGRLSPFDLDVRYAPNNMSPLLHDFRFKNSFVDEWGFSVSAGEGVEITSNFISEVRQEVDLADINYFYSGSTEEDNSRENTRQVTWNDCRIQIYLGENTGFGNDEVDGSGLTEFNVTIANEMERVFTFNRQLTPQDIVPKTRSVTGSFSTLGRREDLSSIALSNKNRSFEDSAIGFGFSPMNGNMGDEFGVKLPNVIFKIENMGGLNNDIVTAEVSYISMPAAGTTTSFQDPLTNTWSIID